MGQPRTLLFISLLFTIRWQIYYTIFETKLKKSSSCAWNSNPGTQDVRRRQIHWSTYGFLFLDSSMEFLGWLDSQVLSHLSLKIGTTRTGPWVCSLVMRWQLNPIVTHLRFFMISVTRKKSPNVYRNCQKRFYKKNDRFWHHYKNSLRMWEIWAN